MRRFFHLYQYIGPALLTPLAAWAWLRHYNGNAQLAALALLVPILHAYIVPGLGTNVLKMWAFNTRLRLGRFRPQHGFVFGSATALLTLACMGAPEARPSAGSVAGTAALAGALLLAVNWIYDALALKYGFLEVYNQPWADGAGPAAIAADYVPWFFGLFGVLYGAGLRIAEGALLQEPSTLRALALGAALLAATVTLPSLGYIAASYIRHGHNGCRPAARRVPEAQTT
jgi:hypothetical protein